MSTVSVDGWYPWHCELWQLTGYVGRTVISHLTSSSSPTDPYAICFQLRCLSSFGQDQDVGTLGPPTETMHTGQVEDNVPITSADGREAEGMLQVILDKPGDLFNKGWVMKSSLPRPTYQIGRAHV